MIVQAKALYAMELKGILYEHEVALIKKRVIRVSG